MQPRYNKTSIFFAISGFAVLKPRKYLLEVFVFFCVCVRERGGGVSETKMYNLGNFIQKEYTKRHDWIKEEDPSGNMQVAAFYSYIPMRYTKDQRIFFSK